MQSGGPATIQDFRVHAPGCRNSPGISMARMVAAQKAHSVSDVWLLKAAEETAGDRPTGQRDFGMHGLMTTMRTPAAPTKPLR
jgi:hypothetical protein